MSWARIVSPGTDDHASYLRQVMISQERACPMIDPYRDVGRNDPCPCAPVLAAHMYDLMRNFEEGGAKPGKGPASIRIWLISPSWRL